jgi:NADH dehydrogenase [ubiquinone] 1 alpha subcomplex assembly factor 7
MLSERLKAEIAAGGPITVAQYMARCLFDPTEGYYATRPNLGQAGDFITAPLVSQMFGELIGLWCAEVWAGLGRPARVIWAELGPGDGTLMLDALRAARAAPGFREAAELWLIEPSGPLKAAQQERLAAAGARWAETLDQLPEDGPLILIANEVLDCLPARQFVRTQTGWAERMVGVDAQGALAFGLASRPLDRALDRALPPAPPGSVLEVSPAQEALGAALGRRLAVQGGGALLIDYGRDRPGFGDTLQALRSHQKLQPLETPGEADLTVHADFPSVLAAARGEGAQAAPILTQGEFLRRLGVKARAAALARARPDRAEVVGRQLERLVGAEQMGVLFKAACVHAPGLQPPGFEAP